MQRLIGVAVIVGAILVTGRPALAATSTLDAVRARGSWSAASPTTCTASAHRIASGRWSGLDVDVCRAVAAAVLGDATKVRYVPLNAQARLTALQSGEVDLLARNTTWTMTRDTAAGLNFTAINYYDGQGFMVPKSSARPARSALSGATVCVQIGTTNELNVADFFSANKMELAPSHLEKYEEIIAAYLAGRCDALSTDVSALAPFARMPRRSPTSTSSCRNSSRKSRLAPAVRQGDDQWFDIVQWSQFAMIEAEERGVGSRQRRRYAQQHRSEHPAPARRHAGLGSSLGLDDRWAYTIIKQVGNYGESFDRNVGAGSQLKLPRGLNALWTQGGLMYAMPFR